MVSLPIEFSRNVDAFAVPLRFQLCTSLCCTHVHTGYPGDTVQHRKEQISVMTNRQHDAVPKVPDSRLIIISHKDIFSRSKVMIRTIGSHRTGQRGHSEYLHARKLQATAEDQTPYALGMEEMRGLRSLLSALAPLPFSPLLPNLYTTLQPATHTVVSLHRHFSGPSSRI